MDSKVEERLQNIELKIELVTKSLDKVQKFLVEDPETTLMHARKSAEAICFELYKDQKGEHPDFKTMQDYINIFRQWKTCPRKVISSLISIQQYCNEAVHANGPINQDIVKPVLASLSVLVSWYFEEYLNSNIPGTISFLSDSEAKSIPMDPGKAGALCILKEILARKKIKVGIIPFPPFVHYNPNGKDTPFEGIGPEMLRRVATINQLDIEFIPIQHEDTFECLQTNKVDMISSFVDTPHRKGIVDFAGKLFSLSIGGVVRTDDDRIKNVRDLKEKQVKIAVSKGEIGSDIVRHKLNITKESGKILEIETNDVSVPISLVESGIADIAITDNLTIQYNLQKRESHNLKNIFTAFPLYVGEIGYITQKNQAELKDWLDEQLQLVRDDEEFKKIENEFYDLYEGAIQPS